MDMLAANISEIWNTLSGISVLLALVAVVFALAIYFLPTILAAAVGNTTGRVAGIGVLNLLFAWTGLGWFALVGWAILGRPRSDEDLELSPFIHTTQARANPRPDHRAQGHRLTSPVTPAIAGSHPPAYH